MEYLRTAVLKINLKVFTGGELREFCYSCLKNVYNNGYLILIKELSNFV